MKPKQLNFEDVWCDLSTTVHDIMIGTVSRESWYEGYWHVYHLCVATPESLAEKLYSAMDQFFSEHVTKLHRAVQEDAKQMGLLKAYYTHWVNYVQGVRYLDRLFHYLNHEWVKKKRVSDADIAYGAFEAEELLLEIGELGLDIWMKQMLQPLQNSLIGLILEVVQLDRTPNMGNPDADYVKGVVDSFVDVESFRKKKSALEFYRKFEISYLDATNQYYTQVSHGLIGNIDCSSFMEKVLQYVRQEELRSRKFLDSSSFSNVIKECERVMVGDHLDFIYHEARTMVAELNCKDLSNMYILLKPLDNSCMLPLIKEVQSRIEKVGEQLLQDIDPENMAQSFVDSVLKVHDDYRDLITRVFNSDQQFIAALDRACISIINSAHPKVIYKAPELLARFCDQVLKKGPKALNDQYELEKRLSKSIIVFKYLDEKDHFQKSYSKLLAKRLIHGVSASMDSEELMINMLKQACGFEYTSKLHRMYTDMSLSTDLNVKFNEYLSVKHKCSGSSLGLAFNISVLQACAWPMATQPVSTFAPPQQLERSITYFEMFYKDKFNGRKLTWLHNLSNADVRLNYPEGGKSYTMSCSTFTMAVALMFEDQNSMSYDALKMGTQLQDDYLIRALQALVEAKLLLVEGNGSGDFIAAAEASSSARGTPSPSPVSFGPNTMFSLNFQFSHRRAKFKITSAPVKEQVIGQEQEQTAASLEEDRKVYLQALIVRIMKVRKMAKHSELIEQVIAQATDRFRPNVLMIKKCIEGLIDKQYIERMPNSADEYSYVS